ncbi:MAG: biotin/lipoyl-containing protein [Ignisphaera sp.]|uniref:Acetyl-CoA carboxylase biotin carboxyl carrier protein subunit n=1 Tax=Ignisphaera aggregans TaxID=334771 RepID=A0A7C4NKR1_9CREN
MSKFTVVIGNKRYHVEVHEEEENVFLVRIGGREYIIHFPQELLQEGEGAGSEVMSRLTRAIEESTMRLQLHPLPVTEEVGIKIASEIPGRLVKLMVKEGDIISSGQTIAVVESMKMIIEIKSPYKGKIKKVFPREGSFIDVGQTIAILEPT